MMEPGPSTGSPAVFVVLAAHGEAEGRGVRERFSVSWRTLAHAAEVMPLPAAVRAGICTVGALRGRFGASDGSRHNTVTRAQARALDAVLGGDPAVRGEVVPAFASADPGVGEALSAAPEGAAVLLVSMIPTDSRLSCGLFCRAAAAHPVGETVRPLARLWAAKELVAVHRAHVAAWLSNQPLKKGTREDSALLVVLHGTLLGDKAGRPPAFHTGSREKDRYGAALREAFSAMPGRRWRRVEIAYLNHAVGGDWSRPSLEDSLAQLAREGVRGVYAYPAEHLVDSAETVRLAQTLAEAPLEYGVCLPCLNDAPALIDFLAERVRSAVASGEALPCDHCPLARAG